MFARRAYRKRLQRSCIGLRLRKPVWTGTSAGDAYGDICDPQRSRGNGKFYKRGPSGGLVGKLELAAGVRADHARRIRQIDGASFIHLGDAGNCGFYGTGAGNHRHLRRNVVHRIATPTRNWSSPGARSTARTGAANGSAARHEPGASGRRNWNRSWIGINTADDASTVRRDGTRSAYVRWRFEPTDSSGALGLLHSRTACDTRRPGKTRDVLRIIREPFRLRLLPTRGWDRSECRLCGTPRKVQVAWPRSRRLWTPAIHRPKLHP